MIVQRRFSAFGGGAVAASIIRLTAQGQPNLWLPFVSRMALLPLLAKESIGPSTLRVKRVLLLV